MKGTPSILEKCRSLNSPPPLPLFYLGNPMQPYILPVLYKINRHHVSFTLRFCIALKNGLVWFTCGTTVRFFKATFKIMEQSRDLYGSLIRKIYFSDGY